MITRPYLLNLQFILQVQYMMSDVPFLTGDTICAEPATKGADSSVDRRVGHQTTSDARHTPGCDTIDGGATVTGHWATTVTLCRKQTDILSKTVYTVHTF